MFFVLLRKNRHLFCLKFAMHILPAKSGKFSLRRGLANEYFITKWLCYIHRQLDCHFKLYYSVIAIIWISKITFWSHRFQLGLSSRTPSSFLSSPFINHGVIKDKVDDNKFKCQIICLIPVKSESTIVKRWRHVHFTIILCKPK